MQTGIHNAIVEALKTLNLEEVDFVVDYPTDKNADADYFSNIALVLANKIG